MSNMNFMGYLRYLVQLNQDAAQDAVESLHCGNATLEQALYGLEELLAYGMSHRLEVQQLNAFQSIQVSRKAEKMLNDALKAAGEMRGFLSREARDEELSREARDEERAVIRAALNLPADLTGWQP